MLGRLDRKTVPSFQSDSSLPTYTTPNKRCKLLFHFKKEIKSAFTNIPLYIASVISESISHLLASG